MDRVAEETRQSGLRVVAVFEGAKGGLVLITGFGLLAFIHRDLHAAAEEVVRLFHSAFRIGELDRHHGRGSGSLRAAHTRTSTRYCQLAMTSGFMRMV